MIEGIDRIVDLVGAAYLRADGRERGRGRRGDSPLRYGGAGGDRWSLRGHRARRPHGAAGADDRHPAAVLRREDVSRSVPRRVGPHRSHLRLVSVAAHRLAVRSRSTRAWCPRTTSSSSIRSAAPIRRRATSGSSIRRSRTGSPTSRRPAPPTSRAALRRRRRAVAVARACRTSRVGGGVLRRHRQHRHAAAGAPRVPRSSGVIPIHIRAVHARPRRRRRTRRRRSRPCARSGSTRAGSGSTWRRPALRPRRGDPRHRGLPPARRRVRGGGAVPAARRSASATRALTYLLDGDGGDENLKSYPLEDSDLTLSSVLRNPLLYQEGWGVDAIKHSPVYSGGLSRSYVRTYAPGVGARLHGVLAVHACAPSSPRRRRFRSSRCSAGDVERLVHAEAGRRERGHPRRARHRDARQPEAALSGRRAALPAPRVSRRPGAGNVFTRCGKSDCATRRTRSIRRSGNEIAV